MNHLIDDLLIEIIDDSKVEKSTVCQSPLTVDENGKGKTTIKIRVNTRHIVSVELDSTVKVVQKNYAEDGFKMSVWRWVVLSVVILVIGIVAVDAIIWWHRCNEPQKADPKASNAKLENGNQLTNVQCKDYNHDKPSKTNKKQKSKKNSTKAIKQT